MDAPRLLLSARTALPSTLETGLCDREQCRFREVWRDKPNCGTHWYWLAGALFLLSFAGAVRRMIAKTSGSPVVWAVRD